MKKTLFATILLFLLPLASRAQHFEWAKYPYYSVIRHKAPGYYWFDIDNIDGTPYNILSGWEDSLCLRKMWLFDEQDYNHCVSHEDVETHNLPPSQTLFLLPQVIYKGNPHPSSASICVEKNRMKILCR